MAIKATLRARRRRRRMLYVSILVAIVAVLLAVYFVASTLGNGPYSSYIGKPVSSTVFQQVTGVSDSTLLAVGHPNGVNAPAAISGSALTAGGKPEVLYIGGDYCPYCAMERWALVVALSHFGTFTGLEYMLSSSSDIYPNTPTFTFRNAVYTSNYITFVAVEEFGRGGQTDLVQPLTSDQQSLVSQFGICPTSPQQAPGIPFVDIANKYAVNCGAQYVLDVTGQNWTQVSSQLDTPVSTVGALVDGGANTLIAAICSVDGGQPASVCTQSYATIPLGYTSAGPAATTTILAVAPPGRVES